jgi:hypothetical protein
MFVFHAGKPATVSNPYGDRCDWLTRTDMINHRLHVAR